jgi:hypothetical protein
MKFSIEVVEGKDAKGVPAILVPSVSFEFIEDEIVSVGMLAAISDKISRLTRAFYHPSMGDVKHMLRDPNYASRAGNIVLFNASKDKERLDEVLASLGFIQDVSPSKEEKR